MKKDLAREFGFDRQPNVVIGGNDAVLAAYSVGINEPGDIINVNGTCEITLVCLPECYGSSEYNIRAHVLPERWLTLYVMNAGGKALDWFHGIFCSEMNEKEYFHDFMTKAVDNWIDRKSTVTYVPYLMGSRYSLEPLKAAFTGLTPETDREECMAALIRGLAAYQRLHIDDIGQKVNLKEIIHITGGALNDSIIAGKRKWLRDCEYVYEDQSSMKGAAMLAVKNIEKSI
jgi:sugar (pentulose or hexulose) kinase